MTSPGYKRTVYILGAGFSVAAGAPVMANFFDAMLDCFHSDAADNADKNALKFAIDFRKEMASASDNFVLDLENLEQLFGLLEIQITAGRKTPEHRRLFVHAVLRTLELKIRTSFHNDPRDLIDRSNSLKNSSLDLVGPAPFGFLAPKGTAWLYHVFAAMVAKTHLDASRRGDSVITFNYDLLLDQAFQEARVPVDYCNGINSWTHDHISFPWTIKGKVPLYKLHGSANWIVCNKHGRTYISPPAPQKIASDYSLLRNSRAACPNCNGGGSKTYNADPNDHLPLIVPPTWNKAAWQVGLEAVWKAAIDDLSAAGRIIVIGFSLPETDLFFRYLLAAGVPIGQGVDVFLFDPSDAVEDNYKKFLAPVFTGRRFKRLTADNTQMPSVVDVLYWRGHFDTFGIQYVAKTAGLL
jgi:hypothetical protein